MTASLGRAIEGLLHLDRRGVRLIARWRSRWLDGAMRAFTRSGDWESWTLLVLVAIAFGDPLRGLALKITPRLLLTLGVCYSIKAVSRRKRPSEALQDFLSLLKNPDPYSFPSSHTACAWVVCASLGKLLGWGWPLWILHASAIGYSRIHVGAHYPLDVLAGAGIGIAIAALPFPFY
jgi:undecaprenyl-diphosphatase